jgi:Fe-S cluster assembly protein SufB
MISAAKGERADLLDRRLAALEAFGRLAHPPWMDDGALADLDVERIRCYGDPGGGRTDRWSEVPARLRATFERLGMQAAERRHLAGLCAQYDSEVVYRRTRSELEPLGVVFTDMDTAIRDHWDLVGPYLGSVVAPDDNKYAALNEALRSGGTFVYVPPGVRVERPLQAYFRVNAERLGQFEHSLVVVGEGGYVHYVDACSATTYETAALHVGVVEVVAAARSRCRITGIQNWPKNVYNLATKRAVAASGATVEWIDANIGARTTLNYPCVRLVGPGAHGSVLSIGYASQGQRQDTGAKMIHEAPRTTSIVVSKSISNRGGRAGYRGVVRVGREAREASSFVRCDSLILDDRSRSDTHPHLEMEADGARIGHEATVSRLDEDRLFYLMSRGVDEDQAMALLVAGFVEPINRELPMECAGEVNRLIALDMAAAGAVG